MWGTVEITLTLFLQKIHRDNRVENIIVTHKEYVLAAGAPDRNARSLRQPQL